MKFHRVLPVFSVLAAGSVLASGLEQVDRNPSQIRAAPKKKQINKNVIWTPNHRSMQVSSPEWISLGSISEDACNSVSLSQDGRTVARGCPNYNNFQGQVFIHSLIDNEWVEQQVFYGQAQGDQFGFSVSLSLDAGTVAIGALYNDSNGSSSGHVRVYKKNIDGSWTQLGQDLIGEAPFDYSGRSVSLSGDASSVAIGAYGNDGNGSKSGHVRVYEYSNNAWNQVGLDIDGEARSDKSGYSVSLSEDASTVAIGAHENNNGRGHVRVYQYTNDAWNQVGLDIDGEASRDYSGISVSLSKDASTVAIGAYGNDANGSMSGHVRVYKFSSNAWNQVGQDLDGEAALDYSGISVSLSGDASTVAIGANGNDANGSWSGHVRVYRYSNSNNAWIQLGMDIDGTSASISLGRSVSLSENGNTLAAIDKSNTNMYSLLDPSSPPSISPSETPSLAPSSSPSAILSELPSTSPSQAPSLTPSLSPTAILSEVPSTSPSQVPSLTPSLLPSTTPSEIPSTSPSQVPSLTPSLLPSTTPSEIPSTSPSQVPSLTPSSSPSTSPSQVPSMIPSEPPSISLSKMPSLAPSSLPSITPSEIPSTSPSSIPSKVPSISPSQTPSDSPSLSPSSKQLEEGQAEVVLESTTTVSSGGDGNNRRAVLATTTDGNTAASQIKEIFAVTLLTMFDVDRVEVTNVVCESTSCDVDFLMIKIVECDGTCTEDSIASLQNAFEQSTASELVTAMEDGSFTETFVASAESAGYDELTEVTGFTTPEFEFEVTVSPTMAPTSTSGGPIIPPMFLALLPFAVGIAIALITIGAVSSIGFFYWWWWRIFPQPNSEGPLVEI